MPGVERKIQSIEQDDWPGYGCWEEKQRREAAVRAGCWQNRRSGGPLSELTGLASSTAKLYEQSHSWML